MLEVKHLSKTYQVVQKKGMFSKKISEKKAVEDISLCIEPGQIVGVLGVNGAGKTTLIKMLATLLEPTNGQIIYDGEELSDSNRNGIRSRINMIAGGERSLYWRLTGKENLMYFGKLYGIDGLDGRVGKCLDLVDLLDAKDQAVEQYSKGMKQRLQIARGIINDPDYIFLDEPTIGLDVVIARSLRSYIQKLAKEENKGIVLTTHYIQEAEELCDFIYVVDHGHLIASGKPEELKSLYSDHYYYEFETDNRVKNRVIELAEKFHVKAEGADAGLKIVGKEQDIDTAIAAVFQEKLPVYNLHKVNPSLEDCLISMIGRESL